MDDDTQPVAGSPDAIWLCYGDLTDWHHERHHREIVREAEVGWCEEPIDSTDVRYVRADIADALQAEVDRMRERESAARNLAEIAMGDAARVAAERDALVHDIEGYVKAASEQAADILRLEAERDALRAELDDSDRVRDQMRDILVRVATALRGEPPPLVSWSWHDLPDRVAAVVNLAAALTTDAARGAKGGSDA